MAVAVLGPARQKTGIRYSSPGQVTRHVGWAKRFPSLHLNLRRRCALRWASLFNVQRSTFNPWPYTPWGRRSVLTSIRDPRFEFLPCRNGRIRGVWPASCSRHTGAHAARLRATDGISRPQSGVNRTRSVYLNYGSRSASKVLCKPSPTQCTLRPLCF